VIFTVAAVPKPLDHTYVPPPVAVLLTLVIEQVKLSVPEIAAVGTVLSCVTTVVAVDVQPLVVLVTVTV
jgi:hypothetical protein